MTTLNYKEIYYTSSERSIITHSAGFGVRTYTSGMDSHVASDIAKKCVFGYSLDDNRKLTFEQIEQNPRIVYDYPPTYIYQKVLLDDGSVKYVFGRTIYIGIDYGYFAKIDRAMRAGTNYFVHLLVFDEMPPASIFAEIEREKIFLPNDYTCSPDNGEFFSLLTGEPELLSPKSMQCELNCDCGIDVEFAHCIVAFLQSYYNTVTNKEEGLRKIIIKATAAQTQELIKKMACLPQALIGDKTFLSNYMGENGVPDDLNMIFVNEFNNKEFYENCHVCVNVSSGATTNVDDNFIFNKIIELGAEGDIATVLKLVGYYINLDHTKELDYQFLYNLFIAVESDKDIRLQDVTPGFLERLNDVHLSSAQETELWNKINSAINNGLTSKKGADVNFTINVVGYILPKNKKHLNIAAETKAWLTNVIFGENPYLSKIVNKGNVDNVILLLDRAKVLSDDSFYNALRQSKDTIIWVKLIQFYYDNNLNPNMETVIENILSSDIGGLDKENMIKQLFPIDKCENELFSYILNRTDRIPKMIGLVRTVCLNTDKERFSLILEQCNNAPDIIRAISPIVSSFYSGLIDRDADSGMKSLLSLTDRISVEVFNTMGVTEPFAKYVRKGFDNPTEEVKNTIDAILSYNITIDGNIAGQVAILNNLFNGQVPDKVDVNVLYAAHKMNKKADYIRELYEAWLKTEPATNELKDYIKGAVNLSSAMIEEIILATWETKTRLIRENREDYVLVICDNAEWASGDRKQFVKSCKDKDLVQHLVESDKLIKKIIRKIYNLFK